VEKARPLFHPSFDLGVVVVGWHLFPNHHFFAIAAALLTAANERRFVSAVDNFPEKM